LPLIALPGISPRKLGERSCLNAAASLATLPIGETSGDSVLLPFTGRRWRQPDEERRRRIEKRHEFRQPDSPSRNRPLRCRQL
ncbi:hypothetical protein, partial [Mesorhizobium sp. M8A.F.Ca.ET.021.01.1.1]|uniref:hypothetical protein n=1 Tax=Mesorhizobium sp. M8A.F.Ca.ET.021.01.1.1 TaxID=2496757 RepID=UPI001AECCA80